MLTLAFESSAKSASVAVCGDSGTLLGQFFQNNGLTHSVTLLSMAEKLLDSLGLSADDIGLVAVAVGPGSFTGVRIGVSAAKGFAWGAEKPVCGISTLEAMSYQLPEPGVLLIPVMDARRGQVYNALFEWQNGGTTPVRLCKDRAVSLDELAAELKNAAAPCVLLGDGAYITYEFLSKRDIPCRLAPELTRSQTAYGVALAAANAEHVPASVLEPKYLRPSQAERELLSKESEQTG